MAETLAEKVRSYIQRQQLMRAGDRIGVAVSGGADSVALLRLLREMQTDLGIVLSVVHLNHQLRGEESDADERFVQALSRDHELEFRSERTEVKKHAEEKRLSLEAAGRELRYGFFRRLLEKQIDRIATAHTMDDQAETVLLRLVRGAGTRGLAGIYPKVKVPHAGGAEVGWIVRPLLGTCRKDVEAYLKQIGQSWREDSSNRDERHARNRVRRGLIPWLEENLNPSIRDTLSNAAEVARAEEEYWEQITATQTAELCATQDLARDNSGSKIYPSLDAKALQRLPLALQRRALHSLRAQGIALEFRHIEQIIEFATENATQGALSLPGWRVRKSAGRLIFEPQKVAETSNPDFAYLLTVPGDVAVKETASEFHATVIPASAGAGYNPEDSQDLLDARLLAQKLQVRNWREGDRFWPAHTKAPRKIKELLQERHVTGHARKRWPVIVSRDEIVWMRGFPSPAHLRLKAENCNAVRIQEISSIRLESGEVLAGE